MAITRKNLVAFCFTILFIISSIHCLPTTARSPGNYLFLCIPDHFVIMNMMISLFF